MDKLCVAERRIKILNLLMLQKQVTIRALKEEFQVSKNTIVRDIEFISCIAPIYTKRGNGGGIYILPEYRSYKENFLYDLIQKVDNDGKRILCGIITKFTKNPMQEHSSFHNSQRKEETDCTHN